MKAQGPSKIHHIVRDHYGWVLARLVRNIRDLTLAEDALQDALLTALDRWPRDGVPDNPRAWLIATARHRAIDELRRRTLRSKKTEELQWLASLQMESRAPGVDGPIRDDMLRLIFTCCHPALSPRARVALTLRAVAGLETNQIARAFLVTTTTMAQRLVRAKNRLRAAGVPYRVPGAKELESRTHEVLAVVYLVFNEGYSATEGRDLVQRDLCGVAIRLGRALIDLLPHDGEALGLLALMLLHDSRSRARTDANGDLVLLEDQDRGRWDHAQIAEGLQLTRTALGMARPGQYTLQAAIAAVHAEARTSEQTDWPQIAALYDHLLSRMPTPVVALNRAVAIAMATRPQNGRPLLDELAPELADYQAYYAVRADLLRRLDRREEAAEAYRQTLQRTENDAERRFLHARLAALKVE
ncbi:MAG: sigma-70 family RNA polymerase sigma factor [Myxococcota bacterium]